MKTAGQTNSAANSAIVANSALKILDVSVMTSAVERKFASLASARLNQVNVFNVKKCV